MALPSSGTLSLLQIQAEFGGAYPISLSEYYRGGPYVTANNTNVPTSGTISVSNFYGSVPQVSITITGNYSTPQNLRNMALAFGWNGSDALLISNNGIISSNTTGAPALTISGPFPNGVTFVNNYYIVGMGGAGGNYGAAGNAGGAAISVSTPVSIRNNSYFAGGGGGGGSSPVFGWCGVDLTTPGGGGGSGLTQAPGGSGGNYSPGNPSVFDGLLYNLPGAGKDAGVCGVANSPSGAGGVWGAVGGTGGYGGGAAGNSVIGNSFITWLAFGNRSGPIS